MKDIGIQYTERQKRLDPVFITISRHCYRRINWWISIRRPILTWLNLGYTFGLEDAISLDLKIITLLFKITFDITVASIVGIAIAIFTYSRLWELQKKLILASQSERRADLLKQIGIDFKIIPSEFDENSISKTHIEPKEICSNSGFKKGRVSFVSRYGWNINIKCWYNLLSLKDKF